MYIIHALQFVYKAEMGLIGSWGELLMKWGSVYWLTISYCMWTCIVVTGTANFNLAVCHCISVILSVHVF